MRRSQCSIFIFLVIIAIFLPRQEIKFAKATDGVENLKLSYSQNTTIKDIIPITTQAKPKPTETVTTKSVTTTTKVELKSVVKISDTELLAKVVNLEAGNSNLKSKMAHIQVIKNRVTDGRLGTTIYKVIYRPNQFTVASFLHKAEPTSSDYKAIDNVYNKGQVVLSSKWYMFFCESSISKSFERANDSILVKSSKVVIDGTAFYEIKH